MNTIYTWGYAGSRPDDLKAFADTLGAAVVDVRYSPHSRWQPRWEGHELQMLVGFSNYFWYQQFGNVNYSGDGPIKLADPALGLHMVAPILAERPIILVCACRDVERCHRKVAAEYIQYETGAPVVHLPGSFAQWQGTEGETPRTIRALSLLQPWASLIAVGAKTMETRSWQTSYRGLLAIHASKAFPGEYRELCTHAPFSSALLAGGIASVNQLPTSAIVAVCMLVGCVPTQGLRPGEPEASFGDYSPGRYAWMLKNIVRIPEPIPARGSLGLWKPDVPVLGKLETLNGVLGQGS